MLEKIQLISYAESLGGGETRYGALRIARGHAAPYPVKVWFIGNEVYFFGRELAEDGERAGGWELEFLRAIKRIDPAAETVALLERHSALAGGWP